MLSICTTIKNRSKIHTDKGFIYPFPNCIESIASSLSLNSEVELVITDWESTDWPLENWIESMLPSIDIHLIDVQCDRGFSAGKGRNIAASQCNGEYIFFMDADMIITREVIQYGLQITNDNTVYYPTVLYEVDNGKQIIHHGGGNVFMTKKTFIESGGWPEYWKHGFEDTDYVKTIRDKYEVKTNDELTIFHQWHPQTKLFKDKFSKGDDIVDQRREFYKKQEDEQTKNLQTKVKAALRNPNTTHHTLNKPVKGENGRIILW